MVAVSFNLESILDGINSPRIVIVGISCSRVLRHVRIGRKCTITETEVHR